MTTDSEQTIRPRPRRGRRWLGAAVAMGMGWFTLAQGADGATADVPVAFTIPSERLGAALNDVALQANLQIFFEEATVGGLTAPALTGTMSAHEALTALLAGTNLEFIQNADQTILVRAKAPRLAAVKPRPHATTTAPAVASAPSAVPTMMTIPAQEGSWMLRARGLFMDPRNRSDGIAVPGSPGLAVPRDGVGTNGRWYPELDLEHFFTRHWSVELALTVPQYQDLDVHAQAPAIAGRVGTFRQMPNALTLKYTFLTQASLRPYVGIGANVTALSHVMAGPYGLNSASGGPVGQVGFDVPLGAGWFFNADAKWARVHADLHLNAAPIGDLRLDPVLYGVGVGYRFGGTPARQIEGPPVAAPAVIDSDGDGVPDSMDECPNTPPGVKVDAKGCPLDSDADGVPDYLDQCPNTPSGVKVDARGCPVDSDGDGVPDYLDQCPGTPPGLKVDARGCEIEELVLQGVTFESGSARLTPQSSATLDSVVAILLQRRSAHVEVHGYTDSVGTAPLNQRLSERRAQAVVDYFVRSGVPADSLSARGFGKSQPVATNATAAGRALNRRVTVQFQAPVSR